MTRAKSSIAHATYNLIASQVKREPATCGQQPATHAARIPGGNPTAAGVPVDCVVQYTCGQNPSAGGHKLAQQERPVQAYNCLGSGAFLRTANGHETDSPPNNSDTSLRCDPELARIVFGLKKSPHLQRYLPLHNEARETGRQGYTYAEFYALMDTYGISGSRSYHARILREGRGLFWNIANGIIYPVGYISLSTRLLDIAHTRGLHDLYAAGNHPGKVRDMYIRVSGNTAQFEGAILASWYAAHNCPTISRWTLARLFGCDRRRLWYAERYADVTIIYNEAETTDPANVPLDADGEPRGDVYQTTDKHTGVITWHFRLANTYQTHNIRQHNRRGAGRKAAYRFKQWFDTIQLHTNGEGEGVEDFHTLVQVNATGRIYCNDDKAMKRSRKRGRVGQLYVRWRPGVAGRVVWQVRGVYSQYVVPDGSRRIGVASEAV